MVEAIAALRERLERTPVALGTFVKLPGLESIECVARSGFDFAVVDMEHSQLAEDEARRLVAYARAVGFPCLVRLPQVDAGEIGRYLEAGAAGIQLSDVRTSDEVGALVSAARFPPEGDRGVSTTHPGGDFGRMPVDEYLSGPRPLLVIQIECAETVDPLEELFAHEIDVCFVGVVDLSVSVGTPGRTDSDAVQARIADVAAAAGASGRAFGHHLAGGVVPSPEARYLTAGTDVTALAGGLERLAADARKT
jgi:2-keto-3-deoxy-L-rhamnonate aldolase RhmA